MPRRLKLLFAVCIAALMFGATLAYSHYRQTQMRNFHAVRDGVLYRSGQMTLSGLQRAINDYGIKTVITLRDAAVPGNPPPDRAEEEYCKDQDINYFRIPPRTWSSLFGVVPADQGVRTFLKVMDNPQNYPVLIHCFAGAHRTGAYCAVYRMEYERADNADALAEMKSFGYSNLDDEFDILGYLDDYRPRWQVSEETARAPRP